MRKKIKLDEESEKTDSFTIFMCGASLAVSVILLQDFITTGITDIPIFISVVALSLSIPILSCAIVVLRGRIEDRYYMDGKLANFPEIGSRAGGIIITVGVGVAFCQLLWIAGALFLIAVLAMTVLRNS